MSVEECREWHVFWAVTVLYLVRQVFANQLKFFWDFHRLFGSRNSRTTVILHTFRHIYRSMWPERSAHDCESRLLINEWTNEWMNEWTSIYPHYFNLKWWLRWNLFNQRVSIQLIVNLLWSGYGIHLDFALQCFTPAIWQCEISRIFLSHHWIPVSFCLRAVGESGENWADFLPWLHL